MQSLLHKKYCIRHFDMGTVQLLDNDTITRNRIPINGIARTVPLVMAIMLR